MASALWGDLRRGGPDEVMSEDSLQGRYDPGGVVLQGEDVGCERRAPESQLGWSFIGMEEPIEGDYEGCAWVVEPSLM